MAEQDIQIKGLKSKLLGAEEGRKGEGYFGKQGLSQMLWLYIRGKPTAVSKKKQPLTTRELLLHVAYISGDK